MLSLWKYSQIHEFSVVDQIREFLNKIAIIANLGLEPCHIVHMAQPY